MNRNARKIDSSREIVLESLQRDLVSAQELRQTLRDEGVDSDPQKSPIFTVLQQLLEAGVQVGSVRNLDGQYVHFTAWKGTIDERCSRAIQAMRSVPEGSADFSCWLCLEKNVDSYEP